MPDEKFIKDARKNIERFEDHLILFHKEEDKEKKDTLERVLDDIAGLIKANLDEVGKRGVHKEVVHILKEYEKFKESKDDEAYSALCQDLQTLKEQLSY